MSSTLRVACLLLAPIALGCERPPRLAEPASTAASSSAAASTAPAAAAASTAPASNAAPAASTRSPTAAAAPAASSAASAAPLVGAGAAYSGCVAPLDFQGAIGRSVIRGSFVPDGERWTGSYRYADQWGSLAITWTGMPEVLLRSDESMDFGGENSPSPCMLEESVAGKTTGAITEGTCWCEGGALWMQGFWSDPEHRREVWVALRGIPERDRAVFERYSGALLRTPRPASDCAPVLTIDDVSTLPDGGTAVVYELRHVCEHPPYAYPSTSHLRTRNMFLAEFGPREPTKIRRGHRVARPGRAMDTDRLFWFWTVELGGGFELKWLVDSWSFQNASDSSSTIWIASRRAEGRPLDLPHESSMSAGCGGLWASTRLFIAELTGHDPPEIVVEAARGEKPNDCAPEQPATVVTRYSAYRIHPNTLRLVPLSMREARLAEAAKAGRELVQTDRK